MEKKILAGRVLKYGDNINTDIISPPQYMELGIAAGASYAMSGIDPDFPKKVKTANLLVAGANFGSGSSRETAPLLLKHLGVQVIIAKFFARIFYRNAINVGLIVLECQDTDEISQGDELEVNASEGTILNKTTGKTLLCGRIPQHLLSIIEAGGLAEQIKNKKLQEASHV